MVAIRDEQATCWNHRLVKGLPVLPMWRLKGPDASKCTSRSRSLTQSRITTCHRGRRHHRHVGDRGTCARGKERQERTEDKRIDVATSLGCKWGIAYVISSSWSNSRRTHSGKPLLCISLYVKIRRKRKKPRDRRCVYPSFRRNLTIRQRFTNAASGGFLLFLLFNDNGIFLFLFCPFFFFVILCILQRILSRITVRIIDC